MRIPPHFDESRPEVLRALIDAHPLATLVTLTLDGLNANHIPLRVIDDPAWLRPHLEALTATHEAARVDPWHVSDAPADYTGKLMQGIVGIEISITRVFGKWKVSQNQPASNQTGVIEGLRERPMENAARMANLVAERRKTENGTR